MKIAVGLITNSNSQYLTEWLAWYRIHGFEKFYVALNNADNATVTWAHKAQGLGLLTFFDQPTIKEHRTQYLTYLKMINMAEEDGYDAVLFVDTDEFIYDDVNPYEHLKSLLSDPSVGQVSLFSRTFGTSGHLTYSPEPVTSRFTQYGRYMNHQLQHIKSCVKVKAVDKLSKPDNFIKWTHYFPLREEFLTFDQFGRKDVLKTFNIDNFDGLVINHYKTKSKEECLSKRGSGSITPLRMSNRDYCKHNDMNQFTFAFPDYIKERLKVEMASIDYKMSRTPVFILPYLIQSQINKMQTM